MPAYERGIYFTGIGSYLALPYPDANVLLFGIRFSISAWINPKSVNGTLFYKAQTSPSLLSVTLNILYLCASVNIDNSIYEFSSIYVLSENQWNHVLVSVNYNEYSSIALSINMLSSFSTPTTNAPFLDSLGTYLYVGSTSQLVDYFQGFIYSLAIYFSSPALDSLETAVCDNCSICPSSGICIPTCNITTYYSDLVVDCLPCNILCVNGCRNSDNCNLCYDITVWIAAVMIFIIVMNAFRIMKCKMELVVSAITLNTITPQRRLVMIAEDCAQLALKTLFVRHVQ